MGNCLVTKLKGSVSNNELLRLGEMRMRIAKVENPTDATQGFRMDVYKPVTLKIIGDGYFTDKTLVENKGKTITLNIGSNSVWVSNNDIKIAILDKYSMVSISNVYIGQTSAPYGRNRYLDLSDLKYSAAFNFLNLNNSQVTGDIANLKNLTALTSLKVFNTQIPLTGNIGDISTLTKCVEIQLKFSKLTGDLAKLPSVCKFASFSNDKGSVFTWSTRPSSAKIIAIEGNASLTNIDKMLQDQAQCQVGFSSNDPSYYKVISVAGNRTSASDDAVATLQQKGYTISITKA